MVTLKKIFFPIFLCAFISFFLGHELVNYGYHEKGKIENTTSGIGTYGFCTSETSVEEEVSFFLQNYASQCIEDGGKNLSSPVSVLPTHLYYSIWLPPDNV